MRTIRKAREPRSLTEYRSAGEASYEDYQGKEELRIALVAEQRGLCCYCLSRIRPERNSMKIEHWLPQSFKQEELDGKQEQLAYGNLLAACLGGEGQPERLQHCDTKKADRQISRNPANPDHAVEVTLRYLGDGRIESTDPGFHEELEQILNLNHPKLVHNRRATLDAFKDALPKKGDLPTARLRSWLHWWSGESTTGYLEPYCEVVVYWLRKRLAQATR
ncbi:MAG: hypothetical protein U0Q16_19530 [Bryobacteraceae bacterium]